MRAVARAVLAVAVAAGLTACGFSNLQFVRDSRLKVVTPKEQALVRMPVTIRWTIRDFHVTSPGNSHSTAAGYFAIFVDRTPIRPGQTMRALFSTDRACLSKPTCPSPSDLAGLGVYTTTNPWLTIHAVSPLNTYQKVQMHEAVIVLMSPDGHRIGESAWYLDFRVRQELV